jgi:hypothetical protein
MATEQVLLSGGWRVSSTSGIWTQAFSNMVSCSAILITDLVIAAGVSETVVSLPQFSNAQVFGLQANQIVRFNWSGHASYFSAASAGFQCTQVALAGSAISGVQGLHIANSSSDSATVRILLGI